LLHGQLPPPKVCDRSVCNKSYVKRLLFVKNDARCDVRLAIVAAQGSRVAMAENDYFRPDF
jgi:hypothetical protein